MRLVNLFLKCLLVFISVCSVVMAEYQEDASAIAMAATLRASVESIARGRTSDYENGIVVNHAHSKAAAQRLSVSGDFESLMDSLGCNDDESKKWLEDQRERLLNLAKVNDVGNHQIEQFVGTVRNIGIETFPKGEKDSFEKMLNSRMAEFLESKETPPDKHKSEIRSMLGLQDEEGFLGQDEELEMLPLGRTLDSTLKCPISGMLYKDPVKSIVCNHIYSKEAIEAHLKVYKNRNRNCPCPVPGCTNKTLVYNELKECIETSINVRKKQRQLDAEHQRQLSQGLDLDDEDEDFDDEQLLRNGGKGRVKAEQQNE